jgi:hypothetical protein
MILPFASNTITQKDLNDSPKILKGKIRDIFDILNDSRKLRSTVNSVHDNIDRYTSVNRNDPWYKAIPKNVANFIANSATSIYTAPSNVGSSITDQRSFSEIGRLTNRFKQLHPKDYENWLKDMGTTEKDWNKFIADGITGSLTDAAANTFITGLNIAGGKILSKVPVGEALSKVPGGKRLFKNINNQVKPKGSGTTLDNIDKTKLLGTVNKPNIGNKYVTPLIQSAGTAALVTQATTDHVGLNDYSYKNFRNYSSAIGIKDLDKISEYKYPDLANILNKAYGTNYNAYDVDNIINPNKNSNMSNKQDNSKQNNSKQDNSKQNNSKQNKSKQENKKEVKSNPGVVTYLPEGIAASVGGLAGIPLSKFLGIKNIYGRLGVSGTTALLSAILANRIKNS